MLIYNQATQDQWVFQTPESKEHYREMLLPQLQMMHMRYSKQDVIQFIRFSIKLKRMNLHEQPLQLKALENAQGVFWARTVPVMLKAMVSKRIGTLHMLSENGGTATVTAMQVYLLMCHGFFQTLPAQLCNTCNLDFSSLFEQDAKGHNATRLKFLISYFTIASEKVDELDGRTLTIKRFRHNTPSKLTSNTEQFKLLLSSHFEPRSNKWEGEQAEKGLSVEFVGEGYFGQHIICSDRPIDYNASRILCHPQTLVAKMICPFLQDDQFLLFSRQIRYSMAKNTLVHYTWQQCVRYNQPKQPHRMLFIKYPHKLREWNITQIKKWLNTLTELQSSIKMLYINMEDQLIGHAEIQWLLTWISASAANNKTEIYLIPRFYQLRDELLSRKTTLKEAVELLRKYSNFRKQLNSKISLTDYAMDFYFQ